MSNHIKLKMKFVNSLKILPHDECGKVILALASYAEKGTEDKGMLENISPSAFMLYSVMKSDFDEDKERLPKKSNDSGYTEMFEIFWEHYPRKTAKKLAFSAFQKINPDNSLLDKMLYAIKWQSEKWKEENYKFAPHPSTWLNQRRWEDECPLGESNKIVFYE